MSTLHAHAIAPAAARVCRCCGRTVTAAQDAEAQRLADAAPCAQGEVLRAGEALDQANRAYVAARQAEERALAERVAQGRAVHGPESGYAVAAGIRI